MSLTQLQHGTLASGGGSTWSHIWDQCQDGGALHGKVQPRLLIVNRLDAPVIAKAKAKGFPAHDIVVISTKGKIPDAVGLRIIEACQRRHVDFLGQHGWLPKTPAVVVSHFHGRMINQHNAPVPEFGGKGMHGLASHCARLEFYRLVGRCDPWTLAITQWVTDALDGGAVLHQAEVPIVDDDTPETLRDRVLPVEHRLQVEFLQRYVAGQVHEVSPRPSLVKPGEEQLLEQARSEGRRRYPHG